MEEEKRLESKRRPVDKREEYFVSISLSSHASRVSKLMHLRNQRLSAETTAKEADDWDVVRVPRPSGTAEWGLPPSNPRR